MRIHNVSVPFAERAKAVMGDELTASQLIHMRIHGEEPVAEKSPKEALYDDFEATDLE